MAIFDHALSPTDIRAIHDAAYSNIYTPEPPSITMQPQSQALFVGDPCTFNATASGSPPLTFQWMKNGASIPGQIRGTLSFPSVSVSDAGTYQWAVTQGSTSITSAPAVLSVEAIPAYVNLTNNMVLHLKFDGDYKDSSGLGNDATAVGSPTFVPGKLGKAVYVNTASGPGTFNYVDKAWSADFAFTVADSFSVSFWINYTSWANDLPMIGNSAGSTYQLGWVFTEDYGKAEFSLVSTANSGTYIFDPAPGSPLIGDGAWHNIAGVVNRGAQTSSVYVDGTPAGSMSIVGLDTLDYGRDMVIGQDPTGTYGVNGAGSIDNVGVWRRALTPIEARSIYFAGQSGHSFDVPAPPSLSLSISIVGGNLQIHWSAGTLQSSTKVDTGYTAVPGATPPVYTVPLPTTGSMFYRAKIQ